MGTARSEAASAVPIPSADAILLAVRAASSRLRVRTSPLCAAARVAMGSAVDARRCRIDPAPADSPNTVIVEGSPPSVAACVRAQANAASWS